MPIYQSLLLRLRSELGLKLILLVTLPTITTAAYLLTQRFVVFPVLPLPLTWIDRVIPFSPTWAWVYVSLYALNPIGPLLTKSRDDLLRYAWAVLLFFVISTVVFVLFPTSPPRPTQQSSGWLYEELVRIDKPFNCLPSLHAACAIFAVLYGAYASRQTTRRRLRNILLIMAWVWVVLILYSTIATRQHFFVDLPPGILLGGVAYWVSFPSRGRHETVHYDHRDSASAVR